MLRRTTFREIKNSLGRYLAIFFIVALGVGFFSGLKITKSVMVNSADQYLKDTSFFDFRLLNSYGFEEEDVEFIASKENVRAADGAYFADIIILNQKGNEDVVKVHSLTEGVNDVVLKYGSMPEKADECVVDSNYMGKDMIGRKLVFSENNKEDDLEQFSYREYTITGIVQAANYVQFERGTTSLGNGRVGGFVYVLPEGFAMDYYTEIYVKLDSDLKLYSEDYDAFIDEIKEDWEGYCEETGKRRYDSIVAEANEELADAQKEFEDEKEDGEKELNDAYEELEEARAEIEDGKAQIEDAKKEIKKAENTLRDKEKELADAENEILENEKLLEDKKAEYEEAILNLENGKKTIEENRASLDSAKKKIADAENEFKKAQEQIDQLNLLGIYTDEEIAAMQAALDNQIALANLPAQKKKLSAGYAALEEAQKQLILAQEQLETGKVELENGEKELADAKVQLEEGKLAIEDGWKEITENKKELSDKEKELADAEDELNEGYLSYEDGKKEFDEKIEDAESEIEDAKQEIADIELPDTYVLGRDTNIGYVCFESDSSIVDGVANVFPAFFFLVAALVCMTTMNRMVDEQRTQIGVLKALGYSDAKIMGKYLFYSGSAAISGCLVGYFGGNFIFPFVIWIAYGLMYHFGEMLYVFDLKLLIISLVGATLCSMGVTFFSLRSELKEVAAGLMRPKAPKAGKRVIFERIPFLWKRLSFLQKVSVRNIFRYKKRFFMMIIGISGCTALLITGYGIKDSVTGIAEQQFTKVQTFEMTLNLKDPVPDLSDKKVSEIMEVITENNGTAALALEKSMDLKANNKTKNISLVVACEPENLDEFVNIHTRKGDKIDYPGVGEVVITEKIADTLGLSVGDMVTITDDEQRTIEGKVSGIFQNYIYNYVYVHPDTYRSFIDEPEYKSIYVNLDENCDVHEIAALLMTKENLTSVTVNMDTLERISNMMSCMNYIVYVIILCAGSLAFIVLFNLNNINITERIREIATIKVLGFHKRETASYVFRENTVLTAIGCGLGIVLGIWLHRFVMHEINIDLISFDVVIKISSIMISVILTFVFNFIVNRFMTGKLENINMAESLKSVD